MANRLWWQVVRNGEGGAGKSLMDITAVVTPSYACDEMALWWCQRLSTDIALHRIMYLLGGRERRVQGSTGTACAPQKIPSF